MDSEGKHDPTHVELTITNGMLEDYEEGSMTQAKLVHLFEEALNLQKRKGQQYGEAWSSQGYMGNVGRVLSKVSRLKNLVWGDKDLMLSVEEESVEDTLVDLINLAAFAILNWRAGNKWGR